MLLDQTCADPDDRLSNDSGLIAMYRVLLSVAAGIMLAGCASTSYAPRSTITAGVPYTLSANEQAAVKSGVTAALKDPTSAIFGEMKAAKATTDGVVTVCGYVNGKNSFGGYVGNQPYVGVVTASGSFVVVAMGGVESRTYAVYSVCQKSGIFL